MLNSLTALSMALKSKPWCLFLPTGKVKINKDRGYNYTVMGILFDYY